MGGMFYFLKFSLGHQIEEIECSCFFGFLLSFVFSTLMFGTSFTSTRCSSTVRRQECGKSSMSPILVVAQKSLSLESLVPLQLFSLVQFGTSEYLVSGKHMEAFFFLFFCFSYLMLIHGSSSTCSRWSSKSYSCCCKHAEELQVADVSQKNAEHGGCL